MISLKGRWYDGKTSSEVHAVCHVYDNGAIRVERLDDGKPLLMLSRFNINISPRLANTPRYLHFPEGEKLETDDNAAADQMMKHFGRTGFLRLVYRLESHKRFFLMALAALVLILFVSVKYGVPAVAKKIAFWLPVSVQQAAGRQTQDILERSFLRPTELDQKTRTRLIKHFQPVIWNHPNYKLTILFRKGGPLGPNAFALPDGTIIFTDEMVRLAKHDDELLAVLTHEIGHIVHRHGMRTVIQDSLLGFMLLAITGDISGSSELFLGLPVLMAELVYSRGFEREADRYSLSYLGPHGIPPIHFARLMRRIDQKITPQTDAPRKKWANYLSTHPLTEKRLLPFEHQNQIDPVSPGK